MKYKAEVKVGADPKWYSNALRFDTFKLAEVYATTEWRVIKDKESK